MSRIYDNKPLESLPVSNVSWQKPWTEQEFTSRGKGVLLEGVLQKRSRLAVASAQNTKHRYFLLHIKINRGHNRQFEPSGKEIEPNFSETEKVRTGYLHSSYKVAAKGVSDHLNPQEVKSKLENQQLSDLQKDKADEGSVILWMNEAQTDSMELNDGDKLRVKTKGDSPFVETIGKVDSQSSTVSNYAGGEQVGASWTDKVMLVKAQNTETAPSGGAADGAGADDDEWDD